MVRPYTSSKLSHSGDFLVVPHAFVTLPAPPRVSPPYAVELNLKNKNIKSVSEKMSVSGLSEKTNKSERGDEKEKDGSGVNGTESELMSIGDETNQVGQMTSHTETERGVLTDGYSSEAAKVPTKEERGR